MCGKGDLQGGEGQLDITSIELLFVANVCVLGTCYHSYKGSSLFGAEDMGLYCGEVGRILQGGGCPRPT